MFSGGLVFGYSKPAEAIKLLAKKGPKILLKLQPTKVLLQLGLDGRTIIGRRNSTGY
jgi:hypothetical protein